MLHMHLKTDLQTAALVRFILMHDCSWLSVMNLDNMAPNISKYSKAIYRPYSKPDMAYNAYDHDRSNINCNDMSYDIGIFI